MKTAGVGPFFLALLLSLGAACSVGSSNSSGGSSDSAELTFDGVSFSGTVSFERVGVGHPTPPQPIYVSFSHFYKNSASQPYIDLTLLIPATIYHGVGTYNCGHELNKDMYTYAYCTVIVEYYFDQNTLGHWNTEMGPVGALPACTVQITEVSDFIRGTIDCQGMQESSFSTPGQPDQGKTLTVHGAWHFQPI